MSSCMRLLLHHTHFSNGYVYWVILAKHLAKACLYLYSNETSNGDEPECHSKDMDLAGFRGGTADLKNL